MLKQHYINLREKSSTSIRQCFWDEAVVNADYNWGCIGWFID